MQNLKKNISLLSLFMSAIVLLSSCSTDSDDGDIDSIVTPPEDNDVVLLRANLSVDPGTITEGENAIITLTLDAPNNTGSSLVFDFSFGGTIDPQSDVLSLANASLIIPDGATETTLEIESLDDDAVEDTETFTLDISDGIPSGATAGTTTNITLNITDND